MSVCACNFYGASSVISSPHLATCFLRGVVKSPTCAKAEGYLRVVEACDSADRTGAESAAVVNDHGVNMDKYSVWFCVDSLEQTPCSLHGTMP